MSKKYRIGEIAKIKNIDPQTLRYYEKMDILNPKIVDTKNGYRYYTIDQFIEVDKIKFYKLLGLSSNEIKEFQKVDTLENSIENLKKQKKQFESNISKMQIILKDLNNIINSIESKTKEYDINQNSIRIENCKSIYGLITECDANNDWYEFEYKLLELTSIYPNYSDFGHNYGISFVNDELIFEKQESIKKIIIPVNDDLIKNLHVEEYHLGECILGYHKGSYNTLEKTLDLIKEFISKNNLKIRGDIVTTSVINEFILQNPDKHLIEIKIPLFDTPHE